MPRFVQDREALHELHLIAKEYGQDPAMLLGIDPRQDPWLAWQIRRATWTWGRWVDARLAETREVPDSRPRRRGPTRLVPKYTYRQALGYPDPADLAEDPEIVAEAEALRRGEIDFAEWLSEATNDLRLPGSRPVSGRSPAP